MAHTKLPWRITEAPYEIVGADGSKVARLTALDKDNAELIVTSANAVPALTAALVEARDALHISYDFLLSEYDMNSSPLNKVGKAIANINKTLGEE